MGWNEFVGRFIVVIVVLVIEIFVFFCGCCFIGDGLVLVV